MKTKTLLGLFVPLSLYCTSPLLAADDASSNERENAKVNLHYGVKVETEPLVGFVSQDSKLKGKISDTGGDPLPGATIQIKGGTKGVIADVGGNFE